MGDLLTSANPLAVPIANTPKAELRAVDVIESDDEEDRHGTRQESSG